MESQKVTSAAPVLPDSTLHNPDPAYLRSLIERANLTQRGAAALIGMHERSMRYVLNGERQIDYPAQYALEVLARGGVADTPIAPPIWFKTKQRPLRKSDAGRLIIGRIAGTYILGRVALDGFGVKVDALPGDGVGSHEVSAGAIGDYVLVDEPEAV